MEWVYQTCFTIKGWENYCPEWRYNEDDTRSHIRDCFVDTGHVTGPLRRILYEDGTIYDGTTPP